MERVILRNLFFMRTENASFFELLKPLTLFGNQDLIFLVPNGSLKPKNWVRLINKFYRVMGVCEGLIEASG